MNNMKIAKELTKLAKELMAVDFPNQKAMNDYLKVHPLAERRNHKVVENKIKPKPYYSLFKIEMNGELSHRENLNDLDELNERLITVPHANLFVKSSNGGSRLLTHSGERFEVYNDEKQNKQLNKQFDEIGKRKETYKVKDKDELKEILKTCETDADLNDLDVSEIWNFGNLFENNSFNGKIDEWDTSNVEDMHGMFKGSSFNGDISKWDTSNVTDMEDLFSNSKFDGDISEWDTSNVINMSYLFSNSEFNGDISEWNVGKVENMNGMFCESEFNGDISKWNVENVKDMEWLFDGAKFNGDISNWNNAININPIVATLIKLAKTLL